MRGDGRRGHFSLLLPGNREKAAAKPAMALKLAAKRLSFSISSEKSFTRGESKGQGD
jgi:hypothetical protein